MSTATKKSVYVTIYQAGGFGWRQTIAKLGEVGTGDYAQYKNVPTITFIEKGKRKGLKMWLTSGACVILDGEQPKPPSGLDKTDFGESSRYGCFDPRYTEEFNQWLADHIAKTGATILHDFRKSE